MQTGIRDNTYHLDTEFISPFLVGVKQVFGDMVGLDPIPLQSSSYSESAPRGDIASIMPMESDTLRGQLCISFTTSALLNVTELLLREKLNQVNDIALDVAGEMTNIVTGVAKALLAERGFNFSLARPATFIADDYDQISLIGMPRTVVPYDIPSGKIFVDLGFTSL